MNENKCPDHPEKISRYCLECVKRISAEAEITTVKQIDAILEEMEKKANFFYNDTYDLANKTYERGFYDGIHNARAKIKEALEKRS